MKSNFFTRNISWFSIVINISLLIMIFALNIISGFITSMSIFLSVLSLVFIGTCLGSCTTTIFYEKTNRMRTENNLANAKVFMRDIRVEIIATKKRINQGDLNEEMLITKLKHLNEQYRMMKSHYKEVKEELL